MFEGLKKYRELAVWLVLGAAALSMLLSLIEVPMRAGQSGFGSFPMAAYYGSSLLGVLPPVVLTLLVVLCLLWTRTPNARLLTLLSMIIIGASVVLELIFELIGLAADVEPWDKVAGFFQTLAGWVIPALCAFALWQLFQALPAPAPAQGQAGQFGPQGQQQLGAGGQYGQNQYGQNQYGQPTQFGQQPTWQLDQASGASWNTAGQAASGASAADWGQPGTAGGWDVGQQSAGHQQSAGYQQSASHQQSASGWGSASHQQSAPHPGEGYPQQVQQPVDQGWGDQPQQQPYGDQQYAQGQQQPYGDQQYDQGQQQPYGDQQYDQGQQQYDQGQQQYDQGQQQYGHPQQGQQPYGDQQYDQGQQQYGYPEPGQHPYGDQQNDQGPEPDEGEGQWRPAPPSQ